MKIKKIEENGEMISYLIFIFLVGILLGLLINIGTISTEYEKLYERNNNIINENEYLKNLNSEMYDECNIIYKSYNNLNDDIKLLHEYLQNFNNTYITYNRTCTELTQDFQNEICPKFVSELYCINNSDNETKPNHTVLKFNLIVDPTSKEMYILEMHENQEKYIPCVDLYFKPYKILYTYYLKKEGLWDNYIKIRTTPTEVNFTNEFMYTSLVQYLEKS